MTTPWATAHLDVPELHHQNYQPQNQRRECQGPVVVKVEGVSVGVEVVVVLSHDGIRQELQSDGQDGEQHQQHRHRRHHLSGRQGECQKNVKKCTLNPHLRLTQGLMRSMRGKP